MLKLNKQFILVAWAPLESFGENVTITFTSDGNSSASDQGFRLLVTAFADAQSGTCANETFLCDTDRYEQCNILPLKQ